jgi:hypothetical protein
MPAKLLDRDDMMAAVTEGVKQGIYDLGSDCGHLDIPHEIVHDAIRKGVADAIWNIATNATHAPCADFFEMIRQGVEDGMRCFAKQEP